jgi:hypothetical protein
MVGQPTFLDGCPTAQKSQYAAMLPVSYLYKRDHSIRIASAGSDKDHFDLMKINPAPGPEFQRSSVHASSIDLPVIPW